MKKELTITELVSIRNLAKDFYAGQDEYQKELEDPYVFISPVEKILDIILGEKEREHLQTIQAVREHLEDYDYVLQETFGCYPYGITAEAVSQEQLEQIASTAASRGIMEIHEAALQVLGINPSVKEC